MAGEDIIAMSVRELRRLQVVHKVLDKEIRQKAAASLMGISERQVRRLVKGVRELGDRGMVHRSRSRPSNRRHPEGVKESVLRLYREQYRDFGPTLAVEKLLAREGISLSRETLRQWLLAAGLWERRRRGRPHRQWRARKELGVAVIQAHSPQVKGRIERLFETLQDRLVKEMRLRRIAIKEAANEFLTAYLPQYNRRFGVTPLNPTDVHLRPGRGVNLDRCLCLKTDHTIRNDHTVAHNGRLYQIKEMVMSRKVTVEERLDGSLHMVSPQGENLKYQKIVERPPQAAPPERPRKPRQSPLPPRDHPWRTSPLKTVARKKIYTKTIK